MPQNFVGKLGTIEAGNGNLAVGNISRISDTDRELGLGCSSGSGQSGRSNAIMPSNFNLAGEVKSLNSLTHQFKSDGRERVFRDEDFLYLKREVTTETARLPLHLLPSCGFDAREIGRCLSESKGWKALPQAEFPNTKTAPPSKTQQWLRNSVEASNRLDDENMKRAVDDSKSSDEEDGKSISEFG